jgi:hypothetical protein
MKHHDPIFRFSLQLFEIVAHSFRVFISLTFLNYATGTLDAYELISLLVDLLVQMDEYPIFGTAVSEIASVDS